MASFINSIRLPAKRSFSWRALWILAALQLLGNVLSIPTLIASNITVEPLSAWILWTTLSIPVIGTALFLGAPLLEGYLTGENRGNWVKSIFGISILIPVAAVPFIIFINQNIDPQGYQSTWKLILASIDAGVQEELFSRLFLVTGLAWLGSLIWHEADGRPTPANLWIAILLSALAFGWAHIDDKLSIPGAAPGDIVLLMLVTTILGMIFGVLYWKLGIECAVLTHFTFDAIAFDLNVPAYISNKPIVQVVVQVVVLIGFQILV